ncbi:MAG TPA: hypothetical protein VFO91_06220, partial [Anaerolineales bacterium]|nr:hypothetical protein [Anaerolineales bacterium]
QGSLYLISNFVAFLWTMSGNSIVRIFELTVTDSLLNSTLQNPAIVYYAIHLILTLVYVPIALRSLYKINIIKLLLIDLVSAAWLTFFLLPSISGQWAFVAYCESCRIEAILEFMSTSPDPLSVIEQYRREKLAQILLRIGFGVLIATMLILAMIKARKRLKSEYFI